MTEQEQAFYNRVTQSLYNTVELSEPIVTQALSEADAEIEGKSIAQHQLFDIAMYRLKVLLKIDPSEADTKLFNEAKKAASKLTDVGESTTLCVVGQKTSEWGL